ncbi:helix-turn-helix domain-containing protein [Microbacterium sp. BWR-S6Y]|uniref:helix-turn-helix domain-containing protein n=1 Tax=Microbacterium sp. BWR-S6Y TaxID=3232073 RepID=UPI0035283F91
MRETVAACYAADKKAVRTAEQLGVHRNTVRQRVDRFEASVGARGVDPLQVARPADPRRPLPRRRVIRGPRDGGHRVLRFASPSIARARGIP